MYLNLSVIDLYLTGKCNYKCEYCYGEDDNYGHMKREIFDKALGLIKESNISTLELCGGEPLISPLFKYAVQKARELEIELILRTNGIYLDKYMDLVANNFKWVGVSLDGTKEVNHIMRPAKFSKLTADEKFYTVINDIRKLKELNPNIKILLASVATKVNYKNLIELLDYLVKCQVPIDEWKIYQFMSTQFRSINSVSKFRLEDRDFSYLQEKIGERSSNFKVIFRNNREDVSGNDCLTITSDGKVKVVNETFGQVGKDSNDKIIENIKKSKYRRYIVENKKETYE